MIWFCEHGHKLAGNPDNSAFADAAIWCPECEGYRQPLQIFDLLPRMATRIAELEAAVSDLVDLVDRESD